MCSQVFLLGLWQRDKFTGMEGEDRKEVEGGEGELICPDVDIEQLDFKDSVSHPGLRVQSGERKRSSAEIFVSFQDRKCLFLCCLYETSRYLPTWSVKLAEMTLHGLLVVALPWEKSLSSASAPGMEFLLIELLQSTGHTDTSNDESTVSLLPPAQVGSSSQGVRYR